jgi:hypothetical protein
MGIYGPLFDIKIYYASHMMNLDNKYIQILSNFLEWIDLRGHFVEIYGVRSQNMGGSCNFSPKPILGVRTQLQCTRLWLAGIKALSTVLAYAYQSHKTMDFSPPKRPLKPFRPLSRLC